MSDSNVRHSGRFGGRWQLVVAFLVATPDLLRRDSMVLQVSGLRSPSLSSPLPPLWVLVALGSAPCTTPMPETCNKKWWCEIMLKRRDSKSDDER